MWYRKRDTEGKRPESKRPRNAQLKITNNSKEKIPIKVNFEFSFK